MQVNERVYREIFNATSDAIFIQDVQTGAILDVNSAMLEMYGYEYNEALQLSIHDLSLGESPYTRTEAWDLICKALEQGPQTFEWLARKKNGESFWVEVVLRRMEIAGKAQILAVVRDITERQRAVQEISAQKLAEQKILQMNTVLEQRVQERTQELDAKARELETFAYSVSHDLKAPLRGIDGYSRLLQQDYASYLDDEGRLFLGHIREAVGRMNQLIEDLLAYARLEQRTLTAQPVDVAAVVRLVLKERQEEIDQRQVRINLDLSCGWVQAETEGLVQALRNLIDNALKFTHDIALPEIEIGCKTTSQNDLLWVKDNGIGFDMQYQDRIFEIFQRLHRSEDYPGTGIGLAIVRKVADRLGGRTWAFSSPGSGTTFYLELPHS